MRLATVMPNRWRPTNCTFKLKILYIALRQKKLCQRLNFNLWPTKSQELEIVKGKYAQNRLMVIVVSILGLIIIFVSILLIYLFFRKKESLLRVVRNAGNMKHPYIRYLTVLTFGVELLPAF